MELTDNQERIEIAIRGLCTTEPIATAAEIADEVSLSKQAVLDNVDEVLEANGDIAEREVGQAKVYYVNANRMDELMGEDVENVVRLRGDGHATYSALHKLPEDDRFDYEVCWYDYELNELDEYFPSKREMGQAMAAQATRPVRIKYYDAVPEGTEVIDTRSDQ